MENVDRHCTSPQTFGTAASPNIFTKMAYAFYSGMSSVLQSCNMNPVIIKYVAYHEADVYWTVSTMAVSDVSRRFLCCPCSAEFPYCDMHYMDTPGKYSPSP